MEINDLKSEILPFLEKWVRYLYNYAINKGMSFNDNVGFGKYVLINRLKNHYSIEILGFQKITNNPQFIIEVKPNNVDLNFLINGGKNFEDYKGLHSIVNGENCHNYNVLYSFSNLCMSVVKRENVSNVLLDDVIYYESGIFKESCDLPFHFYPNSTNIFLNNIAIISRVNGVCSFRRHATTIIVNKNIPKDKFQKLLNNILNGIDPIEGQAPQGIKLKFQIISELKSLAYHKVDETAIDKFIQLISDDFAKALGYKSCKSNIKLEIQGSNQTGTVKQYLTPDFLMEKKDGYYDILDLKIGLLSADFAFGDWTNSYFSSYAQKLLGQLAGYRRYFAKNENAIWARENLDISVNQPKLIGIAGNHNNFDRETVDRALEGNIDDFHLISYNELANLLKK